MRLWNTAAGVWEILAGVSECGEVRQHSGDLFILANLAELPCVT